MTLGGRLRWVGACGAGAVLGGVADAVLRGEMPGRWGAVLGLAAAGAATGAAQAAVLAACGIGALRWTLATAAGGAGGGIAFAELSAALGGRLGFALGLLAGAAVFGAAQECTLPRHARGAGWWLAVALSGAAGGLTGHEAVEHLGAIAGHGFGGLVAGALTAAALPGAVRHGTAGRKEAR